MVFGGMIMIIDYDMILLLLLCLILLLLFFFQLKLPPPKISDIAEYSSISAVADFATLVGTYDKGFALVVIPSSATEGKKALLQFLCLDASIAMEPIFSKFRNVIITSGTLSPLGFYPKLLGFQPVVSQGEWVGMGGLGLGRGNFLAIFVLVGVFIFLILLPSFSLETKQNKTKRF